MTPQGKREALKSAFTAARTYGGDKKGIRLAGLDLIERTVLAYGDERELAGHVEACGKFKSWWRWPNEDAARCGDGWYCDSAPRSPE